MSLVHVGIRRYDRRCLASRSRPPSEAVNKRYHEESRPNTSKGQPVRCIGIGRRMKSTEALHLLLSKSGQSFHRFTNSNRRLGKVGIVFSHPPLSLNSTTNPPSITPFSQFRQRPASPSTTATATDRPHRRAATAPRRPRHTSIPHHATIEARGHATQDPVHTRSAAICDFRTSTSSLLSSTAT